MKENFKIIILQITSILLGLASVFIIAGSLPPEVYAIIGVQAVVISIITVFSNIGLDTYAFRNLLYWKENNEIEKIKIIITQSIFSRLVISLLLFIIAIIPYIFFMSINKVSAEYQWLLFLVGFFSIFNSVFDSTILILKGLGKYFIALLLSYSISIFIRLLALILFNYFGFVVYIIVVSLSPIFALIVALYILKDYLAIRVLNKYKIFIKNIMKSYKFALASYISYPFKYLDSLLVSIVLPAEIFGSFTFAKKLVTIITPFIDNFFDPMLQKTVQYKGDLKAMRGILNKIENIQRKLLVVYFVIATGIIYNLSAIIEIAGFVEYKYLEYYFVELVFVLFIYLAYKVQYNFIALIYNDSEYIKLFMVNSIASIVFLSLMQLFHEKYLFLYMLFSNIIIYLYTSYNFKSTKNPLKINL